MPVQTLGTHLGLVGVSGRKGFQPRNLFAGSTLLLGLLAPYLAQAQVTADTSQAGKVPTVGVLGNRPLVTIARPNAAGLSHNRYTAFNVDSNGLILNNNASAGKVSSGFGNGTVAPNGNLGGVPAKVILNEVTSTNVSSLNGAIVSAGTPSTVVVANVNGIHCNGCEFRNTTGVALVAGRVGFDGSGALATVNSTDADWKGFGGPGSPAGVVVWDKGLTMKDSPGASLWLYAPYIGVHGKVTADGDINAIALTDTIPIFNPSIDLLAGPQYYDQKPDVYGRNGLLIASTASMYAKNIRLFSLRNGGQLGVFGNLEANGGGIRIYSEGNIDGLNTGGGRFNVTPDDFTTLREEIEKTGYENKGLTDRLWQAMISELPGDQVLDLLASANGGVVELSNGWDGGGLTFHELKKFIDVDGQWKIRDTWHSTGYVNWATGQYITNTQTRILPLTDWWAIGDAYRAATMALPSSSRYVATSAQFAPGPGVGQWRTVKLSDKFKYAPVNNCGGYCTPILMDADTAVRNYVLERYDAIVDDIKSDPNSVYWTALERYAADQRRATLKASEGIGMQAQGNIWLSGMDISGKWIPLKAWGNVALHDVSINAWGDMNEPIAHNTWKGNFSIESLTGNVSLSPYDQRLWVNLGDVNGGGGKLKFHDVEKKLGGKGVRIVSAGDINITAQNDVYIEDSSLDSARNVNITAHGDSLNLLSGKNGIAYRMFFDGGSNDEDYRLYDEDLTPSVIRARGNVSLVSDGAYAPGVVKPGWLTVVSSVVNAGYKDNPTVNDVATTGGNLSMQSRRALVVTYDKENDSRYDFEYHKKATTFGLGSKATTTLYRYAGDYDLAETAQNGLSPTRYASQLTGDNINLRSTQEHLVVDGALTKSDGSTSLAAADLLVVKAPVFKGAVDQYTAVKRTGLYFGKFFKDWAFQWGSQVSSFDQNEVFIKRMANTIDALGPLHLSAGGNLEVVGSVLRSGTSVNLTGRDVLIDTALGSYEKNSVEKFKSVGLTVGLTGAVVDQAKSTISLLDKANATGSEKLKDVFNLNAGIAALGAAEDAASLLNTYTTGATWLPSPTEETGGGKGLGVSASFGVTTRKTERHEFMVTGLPSSVGTYNAYLERNAGESDADYAKRQVANRSGNVNIKATGSAANGFGFLNVVGSTVLGQDVALTSNADTTLQSFEAVKWATEKTAAKNVSVGVAGYLSTDGSLGVFVEAGGALSNGSTHSIQRKHMESNVVAKGLLTVNAGDDLTLSGAMLKGRGLDVDVTDQMELTSLQDYSTFTRNTTTVNGKVSIPVYGAATSAAASGGYTKESTKALHQSVVEKTGMEAGHDGFDIVVGGHTSLVGAVIASTAVPLKNRLVTNTFSHASIANESKVDIKSEGYAISVSGKAGTLDLSTFAGWEGLKSFLSTELVGDLGGSLAKSLLTNVTAGLSVSDGASSVTASAVSGGTLVVKSGNGATGLSRAASSAGEPLANVYDKLGPADRKAYAKGVYDWGMAWLNIVAEQVTEYQKGVQSAKQTEVQNAYYNQNATPGMSESAKATLLQKAKDHAATAVKETQEWKDAQTQLGLWDVSNSAPGAGVAAVRGGLQVLRATMVNDRVRAGGTGLIISQMAQGIADALNKQNQAYTQVWDAVLQLASAGNPS